MKQSILAVDDEPDMLKLLERIIRQKTGYDIVTTNNSLEVEEILRDRRFDIIITDLKMPGKGGLDILGKVKREQRFEEVIILTAFGSLDSITEALSLGVTDFIRKPFRKEEIINSIERVMHRQRQRREKERMDRIFEIEPYEEARKAFRDEYIRRKEEGGQTGTS